MTPETGAKYANILYPILNAEAINKGEMEPDALGVEAIDDRTLEITLERSRPPTSSSLLTHQTGLPVHPASVEAFGADFVQPGNMVSNGAYRLTENILNDKIVMVKNPKFHDAANVAIDAVDFLPIEDRATCVRRFEAGEVHSCSDLPAEQIARLERAKLGDQVRVSPYLGTYYYAVNTRTNLSDRRERPPGAVDGHRPRVPRRGDLPGHDAAGLRVRAARHRQLRHTAGADYRAMSHARPRGSRPKIALMKEASGPTSRSRSRSAVQHLGEPQE